MTCVAGTATCEGAVLRVCSARGFQEPDVMCDAVAACDAAARTCIDAASLPRVSVGVSRGCVIEDDRTVRCWGINGGGADFSGEVDHLMSALEVPGVDGVRQVSADQTHICALQDDGTVTCWGSNYSAEVDFPDSAPVLPKTVDGVEGAVEISASYRCTCARIADGTVTCWGERNTGCLGLAGDPSELVPPTQVEGVTGAVQLRTGSYSVPSCARLATGEVTCWSALVAPSLIPEVDDALDVAVGNEHVLIQTASRGVVWSARDLDTNTWLPATLYTADDYVDIEADWTFCGLRTDGVVECAPLDVNGEPPPPQPIPDPPAGMVAEIAVGRSFRYGADLQCLRLAGQPISSAVYCWGDNIAGGLGAGGPDEFPAPLVVTGVTGAATVSASQYATSVVLADGTTRVWGTARGFFSGVIPAPPVSGMFGTGNALVRSNDPYNSGYLLKQTGALQYREEGFIVPNGRLVGSEWSDFVDVLHFSAWDIGLRTNGAVVVYGHLADSNATGIFGDGTTSGMAGQSFPVPGLGPVEAVAAYGPDDGLYPSHACAIVTGGTLWCWGENYWGQIGNGQISDTPVTTPTQVAIPDGEPVISVAAGRGFTCAAVESGKVYCWGSPGDGQLGVDVLGDQPLPIEVTGVTGAVGVTARWGHACAWLTDETVTCWGEGSRGQLGNGTFEDQPMPVPVTGLSAVVQVSAGVEHTCARHADGALSCWGSAYWGQIGNGVDGQFPSPLAVQGL